jgi:uncharacterized protein
MERREGEFVENAQRGTVPGDLTPAGPPPPVVGPLPEPERIVTLDALRGFALLGVFMVNMLFFSMPFGVALGGEELAAGPASERLAWGFVQVIFTLKFISLFSLMFGMGLVVALQRSEAAGRPFVPLYLRRLGVLAVFGLVHGFFLWYGDILFTYAVLGLGLLLLRNLTPRALLLSGGALIAVSVLLGTAFFGLIVLGESLAGGPAAVESGIQESSPEADSEPLRGFEAMAAGDFDFLSPEWIEGELLAYREGPFGDAFAFRAVSFLFVLFAAAFQFAWRVLGFFFVGAALMKLAFFRSEWRPWHRRLAIWGLAVGIPLELLGAWITHLGGYGFNLHRLVANFLHETGSIATAFGYAGLVALVVSSGALGPLVRGIAALGRMALTNYLLQTVVATFLMYWWGLGWFGEATRVEQVGLVVVVYAAQVVFSVLWLRAFRFGPFEWLWRSLTYGRWQPMAR